MRSASGFSRTGVSAACPFAAETDSCSPPWKIANLGTQERAPEAYGLIAEILDFFDLAAIQETRRNLDGLRSVLSRLGRRWSFLCTDTAGNEERMFILYDRSKLRLREQIAEVAIPPAHHRYIRLPGIETLCAGLDRYPQVASLFRRETPMTLGNVHLYFGSGRRAHVQRRQLEARAVARWARLENGSPHAFDPHVILLGDFNLPFMEPGDPILSVLQRERPILAPNSTEIGTTLPSEASGRTAIWVRHYDQIDFFPGTQNYFTGATGVFDFDTVVLPDLWERRGRRDFNAFLRYHFSNHRPLGRRSKRLKLDLVCRPRGRSLELRHGA